MSDDIWGMELEFRDIEYVDTIIKCGGVSKAAEALHITQPALSIYVKSLEQRLGLALFSRVGRNMFPTYAGVCLAEQGRELLLQRGSLQRRLNDIKNQRDGLLRVGFSSMRGVSFLPVMLQNFRQLYPEIEVRYQEQNIDKLEQMLLHNELDVAFFDLVDRHERLEYEHIFLDTVVLYMSKATAAACSAKRRAGYPHPWVDIRELAGQPFIRNFPEQNTERIVRQVFRDYGIAPETAMRVRNQVTSISLAAYGYGVYIAPQFFVNNLAQPLRPALLSFGETPTQYGIEFVAATVRGGYVSRAAQSFIQLAKEVYGYDRRGGR